MKKELKKKKPLIANQGFSKEVLDDITFHHNYTFPLLTAKYWINSSAICMINEPAIKLTMKYVMYENNCKSMKQLEQIYSDRKYCDVSLS